MNKYKLLYILLLSVSIAFVGTYVKAKKISRQGGHIPSEVEWVAVVTNTTTGTFDSTVTIRAFPIGNTISILGVYDPLAYQTSEVDRLLQNSAMFANDYIASKGFRNIIVTTMLNPLRITGNKVYDLEKIQEEQFRVVQEEKRRFELTNFK